MTSLLHLMLHLHSNTNRKIATSTADDYDEDTSSEFEGVITTCKPLVFILAIFFQRPAMPTRRLFPFTTAYPIIISSLTRPLVTLRESWAVDASPGDAKITNRHSLYTWTSQCHEDRNRKDDDIFLDQIRICFWRISSGSMLIVTSSTP
jgi:hypothetical protein